MIKFKLGRGVIEDNERKEERSDGGSRWSEATEGALSAAKGVTHYENFGLSFL